MDNKTVFAISTYRSFYFKRIRRIFPLSLMVMLSSLIVALYCDGDVLYRFSKKSAIYAALFITNVKGDSAGEQYFRDLQHADDLFTHTWSLSVEIQFYLIAPLLLHILKPQRSQHFHSMGYFCVIAGTSFVFSILYPTSAFYSTFARLWQFIAGGIAFHLQARKQQTSSIQNYQVSSKYLSCLSDRKIMVALSMFSVILVIRSETSYDWDLTFRYIITLIVAVLIVHSLTTPWLSHRSLQIIGDLSYALYLIHWPVVCFLRVYENNHWMTRFFAMVLCVVASWLVHEIFEKWYITLSEKRTFVLVGFMYIALLISGIGNYPTSDEYDETVIELMDKPRTYDEAKRLNLYMDHHWEEHLRLENCVLRDPSFDRSYNPWGFCDLPSGNGNLSILVIGNSYAANHGTLLLESLKNHYGRIAIHTVPACEPWVDTEPIQYCDELKAQEKFLKDITTFKPDVLFMEARYLDPNIPIDSQNIINDTLFINMRDNLRKYENYVQKVFIIHALPRPADLQKIENARLKRGMAIEDLKEEMIEADAVPMRKRIEEIAKHCDKCVIYDLMQLHFNNGTFMVSNVETHLHYFDTMKHHTQPGLKLISPLYRKLSENFEELMKSKSPNNVLTWNASLL